MAFWILRFRVIYRSQNYFGRSTFFDSFDEDVYADISDLKIFDRALIENEILEDFNQNIIYNT